MEIESFEIEEGEIEKVTEAVYSMTTRMWNCGQGILKRTTSWRVDFAAIYFGGVLVLNLVSSPGTGKTAFWSGRCAICSHMALVPLL